VRLSTAVVAFAVASTSLALGGCAPPMMPARSVPAPPEPPPSVVHQTTFFEGFDGSWLWAQSWKPRERPRAVMIVVHGLKDHGSRYAELAVRLAGEGVAVHALDLRGHAHSSGIRVGVESFDDYLRDLDAYLRRVRAEEPAQPLFLFGHSMGGAISTRWVLERKPELAGLVLSGAALAVDVPAPKVFGTKLIAALAPNAGVFDLDLADFSRDPRVVEECKHDPLVYGSGAPARTARELLASIAWVDARMEEVAVPLLVMHGAADKVTDPKGSQALVARARSRDKTLALYPGLVHDLVHEPEKAKVIDDVARWVAARAR